ncbi:MAG: hydantoinase/oxoprolinase family protein [Myxococcota bacterium]
MAASRDDTSADAHMNLGVDTGGTFTDVVGVDAQGRLTVHKLLSTPDDPSRAIAEGVAEIAGEREASVIHGTTVATNALLERDGATCAFVTTHGFEDLLFLRRQNRPDLYAFDIQLPEPLVQSEHCFGVDERLRYDGKVLCELEDDTVSELVDWLGERDVDAVAICLLHAYANDAHEQRLVDAIREAYPDLHVSASSDVLPEFREFERASTTAINAYVGPIMSTYLRRLESRVEASDIEVMLSSGGRSRLQYASKYPVHTALSGPAGGVVGALACAREVGVDQIITLDMGGTSTDVSLCAGELTISQEAEISGMPLRIPVIDIHTVGAGGGSLAQVNEVGGLRVGPESAGADPGPACYGRGGERATVTDAHLVLGRLRADRFLGGAQQLDLEAAQSAVAGIAADTQMSVDEAAAGILDIADARMVRALKVISLERGHDPRDFALVSFGGAGGLHACRLADELDIERVIIPRSPGVLSAYGMLSTDPQRRYSASVLEPLDRVMDEPAVVLNQLEKLQQRARGALAERGEVEFAVSADLRYLGQSFEINIPVDWDPTEASLDDPSKGFAERHETLYGYRDAERSIELVAIRLRASVPRDMPDIEVPESRGDASGATCERVRFKEGWQDADIIERASLAEGDAVAGPCIITEYSGTTVVPRCWSGRVECGHIVLEVSR